MAWWKFQRLFRRNPKRRHCPVDWADLEPHSVEGASGPVAVERCPKCHGVYLDRGEVLKVTGDRDLATLLTRDLGLDADSPHICPGCGHTMDAEQAGKVRVDVCLGCKGVWVDTGELVALKALAPGEAALRSPEKTAELERAKKARSKARKDAILQAPKDVAAAAKKPFRKR